MSQTIIIIIIQETMDMTTEPTTQVLTESTEATTGLTIIVAMELAGAGVAMEEAMETYQLEA